MQVRAPADKVLSSNIDGNVQNMSAERKRHEWLLKIYLLSAQKIKIWIVFKRSYHLPTSSTRKTKGKLIGNQQTVHNYTIIWRAEGFLEVAQNIMACKLVTSTIHDTRGPKLTGNYVCGEQAMKTKQWLARKVVTTDLATSRNNLTS